jgi:epoxyqueuosine reductase
MSLEGLIKEEAHRLGFHLAGITTPDPPPHYNIYRNWLEAGRHGEMAYLASDQALERRADPLHILPECKSILVLGTPYPSHPLDQIKDAHHDAGDTSAVPINPRGQVSCYAWGEDYHNVIPKRMQELVHFIENQVKHPVSNRWYTDTGPLLERDFAQRAGLGWIGKNTCLINPHSGSYFFLSEILLDIHLTPDQPFSTDHCGSCTRCIDACPTACILPDRTIDAQRCISYLTIELKGEIPAELRSSIGNWVFGCDLCQQVCPWNQRFASQSGDPAFEPRPDVPNPDLIEELSLSPEAFNRKFKGSPIKRSKRRGYLRNVTVALGNSGDPAAIPALSNSVKNDPEPLIRSHAAWALEQINVE